MMKPGTALVLSGGGYFGAYQCGVWKALHARWRPDFIVGASVGALNGWPIAAGCDPDELGSQWLHPETASCFTAGGLMARARRLCLDYCPTVPFGLVILQVPSLKTELIPGDHVTPAHLVATCSLPVFFPPVQIGAARYIDGGLIERLPLWAAVEMGAKHIVAVDLMPGGMTWWANASASVLRSVRPTRAIAPEIGVTMIAPERHLGSFMEAKVWKRENIERWMKMGERDASRTDHRLL